ncbi:MAG: hypothetical protein HFG34_06065 [Eubacterium sp.]|nr:hypothetical protein [Eubacterium sp.]
MSSYFWQEGGMFFSTLEEALTNGYRLCKICMKELWR